MDKTIFVYSMFTFNEYKKGINNTNSHIFNWLKSRSDVEKIFFIDFNRVGFIGKLKYFIKFILFNKINKFRVFYQVEKIDYKIYHYLGISYAGINKIIKRNNLKNIEIWSFNPLDTSFLDIKTGIKIFYSIDDWRENSIFKQYKKKLNKNYAKISSLSDFIFVNNKKLKEKIFIKSNKVYFIPNGVDTKYFKSFKQTSKSITNKIDKSINKNKKPIIGYMGVITSDRVDIELVEYCLKNNPEKYFIFAGPVWGSFNSNKLQKRYNNIKFIGLVYYNEIPYLFSRFDVCIIPHHTNDFIQSMDPKKMYEYLASGKPVVTTSVSGTEKFSSNILYISKSNEDFSNKINQALNENNDPKITERLDAIKPHDWSERFKTIEKIIKVN